MKLIAIILFILGCVTPERGVSQVPDTIKVVEFEVMSKGILCFIDGKLISKKRYQEISNMNKIYNSLKVNTYVLFYSKKGKLSHSYLSSGPDNNSGEAIIYFKNGRIKAQGEILDNDFVGEWKYYNKRGKIKEVIDFGNKIQKK